MLWHENVVNSNFKCERYELLNLLVLEHLLITCSQLSSFTYSITQRNINHSFNYFFLYTIVILEFADVSSRLRQLFYPRNVLLLMHAFLGVMPPNEYKHALDIRKS